MNAHFSGPSAFFNLDTVSRLILDLLNNYGGIKAYDPMVTVYPVVSYRAEFYDTKDAEHATVHLNGFRIAVSRPLSSETAIKFLTVSRAVP